MVNVIGSFQTHKKLNDFINTFIKLLTEKYHYEKGWSMYHYSFVFGINIQKNVYNFVTQCLKVGYQTEQLSSSQNDSLK